MGHWCIIDTCSWISACYLSLLVVSHTAVNLEMRSGGLWVLANLNVTGYYRVNYDLGNWERLLTQLRTEHQVQTHSRFCCLSCSPSLVLWQIRWWLFYFRRLYQWRTEPSLSTMLSIWPGWSDYLHSPSFTMIRNGYLITCAAHYHGENPRGASTTRGLRVSRIHRGRSHTRPSDLLTLLMIDWTGNKYTNSSFL